VGMSRDEIVALRHKTITAACLLDWEGFLVNGKPVPLTKETREKAVLTPWLLPQILMAIANHAGFSVPS
jgi:hypothetical protein